VASIELKAVSKTYGDVVAVKDVTLAVRDGEFTTILGPSGSGKTTLLNLIAGLVQPTSGQFLVGGQDITNLPPSARKVGLVFQNYALFPHLSVYENIAFPLRVRHFAKHEIDKRVEEALALVRLDNLGARKPAQLSGGQQQRVAIARALVFQPDILLLDEPLAALDRKLREEVRREIRHIQRTVGITTVLVTHDQEEALSLSDKIVVLDRGCIQQIATPEAAYYRPATRFVANFLGDANLFEGTMERQGCEWRLVGHRISIPCPAGTAPEGAGLCAVLRPERVQLTNPVNGCANHAVIEERLFLGQHWQYRLKGSFGGQILAVNGQNRRVFEPGETVGLEWNQEDIWFIADDDIRASPMAKTS
jgi:putative spermidine/putrescine transport system ATP-binding protein